ncbi:MAG: helix-turn-helix domain-containing protein [Flavobacterium piscis]|nr:helix-turn-helix domain-containing protein [Flavobacterium piscis]
MESFGEYIRRHRIEQGLNQTELAAKIGLDSGGLSKVENGKKEIKENKLELLAKALNISIKELKEQYLSEKFAETCYEYNCSENVFQLAEKKVRYYKTTKIKQGKLNL